MNNNNNNNNNNHYFFFTKNNIYNFLHINTNKIKNISNIKDKNIVLLILDEKIPKTYIYFLLKELHIIKLYYLSNILQAINFEYILIKLTHLYITCKKTPNNIIFTNIYESNMQEISIINNCKKHISSEDLLHLILSLENSQYKMLTFHEKTYIKLNKYLYKFFYFNGLIFLGNLLVYFKLIANK